MIRQPLGDSACMHPLQSGFSSSRMLRSSKDFCMWASMFHCVHQRLRNS